MLNIAEKVVVITGAASGIGLSLAKKLSGSDNRLVLADLDYDRLESIREYVDAEIDAQAEQDGEQTYCDLVEVADDELGEPEGPR